MSEDGCSLFGELDPRVDYFIRGAPVQNFGDYLPELMASELMTYPRIDADVFRFVGSVIESRWARRDLSRATGHVTGLIAYWCCGARNPEPLDDDIMRHCRFFGARGPLTRDLLKLSADTPLGDPGLLAPLFHEPRHHEATAGKAILIPHTHDPGLRERLLRESGVDILVPPEIDASEAALREILDKIASADFVLTGSLHGAIIACAYERPFAFFDAGHIDIPFKWEDFAASIGMECAFVRDLAEGRARYEAVSSHITVPSLTRILDACPFVVRPSAFARAMAREAAEHSERAAALERAAASLDGLTMFDPDEILRLQRDSVANRRRRSRFATYHATRLGRAARAFKARAVKRLAR